MAIKVGINGFGRIGRAVVRTWLDGHDIELVGVNDLTDTKTLAHLLKYDSIMGNLGHKITHGDGTIDVEGDTFRVFSEKDPSLIPWEEVGAEIVIESTGRFTKAEDAAKAPPRQREEGRHFGSCKGRGRDHRARRQREHV